MAAYVDNMKQGREHLSHPSWTGEWGKMALDWAWEDRARTPETYDPAAREQDVATRFWERVLTPGTIIHAVLSEGQKESNLMRIIQSLYLFGRHKWQGVSEACPEGKEWDALACRWVEKGPKTGRAVNWNRTTGA